VPFWKGAIYRSIFPAVAVNLDSLARFFEQGEQVEPENVNGVRRFNAGGKVG